MSGTPTTNNRILFLHAVGGSSASWRRQLEFFGGVAIDLIAETIEGMADQAASYGPAHMVGLSMGGVVALQLYKTRPDLVRSLTLACTWDRHPAGKERIQFLEDSLARMSFRQFVAGSRPFLLAPDTPDEIAEIEASKDPALYRKQWRAMFEADLRGVTPRVPVLLIGAPLDRITPIETCLEPMHRRIPGSKLVVIPGANHFVNIDRPQEFNRALAEFLGWK